MTSGLEDDVSTGWGFARDRLYPGDILLTTRQGFAKGALAIRVATASHFTHAALYTGDGLFIEADGRRVCRLAIGAAGVRGLANMRLLRLDPAMTTEAEARARTAAEKGESFLYRPYSASGAVGAKLAPLRDPRRAGVFCSQLVARAYREAGIQLLPGKTPEAIAPGDFLASDLLSDVTDTVVVPLPGGYQPTHYLDDREARARPHHLEADIKLATLKARSVRRALRRLGATPASFADLEIVLAQSKDPIALDVAVFYQLQRHRLTERYFALVADRDDLAAFEQDTGMLAAALKAGRVSDDGKRWLMSELDSDIRDMEADLTTRMKWRDVYEGLFRQRGLKTFGYLEDQQAQCQAHSRAALDAFIRRRRLLGEAAS